MKSTELRQLIRESINEYIRDIDEAGNKAALDAKMTATQEAIDLREKKMNMDGLDEAYHDMLDKGKVKELGGEVKALKKSLDKLKKQLDKLNSKGTKTEKPESEEKEIVDEIEIDETFPESGSQLEEDNDEMDIYESLHMQKLAGIISESEYKKKIDEVATKTQLFTSLDKKNLSDEKLNDLGYLKKLIDNVLDTEYDTIPDNPETLAKEYIARSKKTKVTEAKKALFEDENQKKK
jgi:hypothetical protein